MPTNYYVKEIVLSTIVATIISYYYFINKPVGPSESPTIVSPTSVKEIKCEPGIYSRYRTIIF